MKRTLTICIALLCLCAFAVCAASPGDVLYGDAYIEWNESQVKAWITEHIDQTDLLTTEKDVKLSIDGNVHRFRYSLSLDTETNEIIFTINPADQAESVDSLTMRLQPNGWVEYCAVFSMPEKAEPLQSTIKKQRDTVYKTDQLLFMTDQGGTQYWLDEMAAFSTWEAILTSSCNLHFYQLGFYRMCPNHVMVVYRTEDASCDENGVEYSHCETCRRESSAVIPGGTHTFGEPVIIKEPTCEETGLQKMTCTRCGYVSESIVPSKGGHQYWEMYVPASTQKDGFIREECSVCGEVFHNTVIPRIASITLSTTEYYYNGKAKRPKVMVKDRTGAEITDYTVSYAKGRKLPGVYPVHIRMITDSYAGDYVQQFTIAPARATGLKVTGKKLTWNKVDTAQKYVVYYRVEKTGDFKKLRSTTKTAVSLKKLDTGKTIYFKVRTYFRDPVYDITIWGKYSPAIKAKLK